MRKSKKKKTKRSETKYPGLVKEMNLKIRQELIDQDYINKLSEDEKKWLNQFNKEYITADFRDKKNRLHPKKYTSKTLKSNGQKKKIDIYKKDCEDKNNSRNRDAYSITKVNNMLKGDEAFPAIDIDNRSTNYHDTEDALIDYLDNLSNTSKDTSKQGDDT